MLLAKTDRPTWGWGTHTTTVPSPDPSPDKLQPTEWLLASPIVVLYLDPLRFATETAARSYPMFGSLPG